MFGFVMLGDATSTSPAASTPTLTYIDPRQEHVVFPSVQSAWPQGSAAPGLLAWGGDLSVKRLIQAYTQGIFPWFGEGEPILWWSTDPRMVLYPAHFRLKRSLRKTLYKFLKTPGCEIRIDSAFEQVIQNCSCVSRQGQDGTWILPPIQQAYINLHAHGVAHSFETWVDGELVGGLYGIGLGGMFYGESMFTHRTDASKLALCALIAFARRFNIPLIDCQQQTQHLASLGGVGISRVQFIHEMHQAQRLPSPIWGKGVFPRAYWSQLEVCG